MIWIVFLLTTELSTRRLTAMFISYGIRSLIGFGNLVGPLAHSVLYLHTRTHNAAPKCISGRTSYLCVRLAFHRTNHNSSQDFSTSTSSALHPEIIRTSAWPWLDHAVSGLPVPTRRPIRTRFPSGSASKTLNLAGTDNSQAHSAKGTPSHILRLLGA